MTQIRINEYKQCKTKEIIKLIRNKNNFVDFGWRFSLWFLVLSLYADHFILVFLLCIAYPIL